MQLAAGWEQDKYLLLSRKETINMSNTTSTYRIDGMEVQETSTQEGARERLMAYASRLSSVTENGMAAESAAHAGTAAKEGGND